MYPRSPSDEPSARDETVGIPAAVRQHPAGSGSVPKHRTMPTMATAGINSRATAEAPLSKNDGDYALGGAG